MIYSSVAFIFFLAFSLIAYSFVSAKWRLAVIMLLSLIWYSSWGPASALLLGSVSLINFFLLKTNGKKNWFYPSLIALNILFFVFLKSLNYWGAPFQTPYGTSFFMLLLIGYIANRWLLSEKELSFTEMHSYLFFFPALVGGPLERTKSLVPQLLRLQPLSFLNIIEGGSIFAFGFLKKFLVSDNLLAISQIKSSMPFLNIVTLSIYGILATLQAYLDFSSYCDMGRGAAHMFGIRLSFNFRPFYYSSSPSDFWQRWNITLGTWIRDFITFPMMLNIGRRIGSYPVLIFSFLLVGLWHGLTWNWLIFGLFNGLLVVLHLYSQKLVKNTFVLALTGFFGAVLIYAGNGIFQNPLFWDSFKIAMENGLHQENWGLFFGSLRANTSAILWAALPLLFIFEFFQEKTKDLDFYLKAPKFIKLFWTAGFFFWLLFMLYNRGLVQKIELPPLYFQL